MLTTGIAVVALDFLNGGKLALATLLAVQRDQHASSLGALRVDDLHHLANRRTGSDHVINNQHA